MNTHQGTTITDLEKLVGAYVSKPGRHHHNCALCGQVYECPETHCGVPLTNEDADYRCLDCQEAEIMADFIRSRGWRKDEFDVKRWRKDSDWGYEICCLTHAYEQELKAEADA